MNAPIPDWAASVANDLFESHPSVLREAVAQTIANAHLRATQTTTCVYCGHEYPPNTPASQSAALHAHIKVCEKHPLGLVRRALVGLVGVDTPSELDQMEAVIRLAAGPAEDKVAILDAIHALRATL